MGLMSSSCAKLRRMNRYLFRIYNVLAIPFVIFVVALNLLHPLVHSLEAGSLDSVLPMLDAAAFAAGGGSVVEWARRVSHRHHHHDAGDCSHPDE